MIKYLSYIYLPLVFSFLLFTLSPSSIFSCRFSFFHPLSLLIHLFLPSSLSSVSSYPPPSHPSSPSRRHLFFSFCFLSTVPSYSLFHLSLPSSSSSSLSSNSSFLFFPSPSFPPFTSSQPPSHSPSLQPPSAAFDLLFLFVKKTIYLGLFFIQGLLW